MSQGNDKTIQDLQREVDKLQRALKQEELKLKSFSDGLEEVNTGLMSLIDNNFDGNVYRNALEHSFKEHVYTKIRNVFGTIAIIAGIGGFFFVNVTIENLVEKTINEQQTEFVAASENLTRERLIFMLRELKERGPERASEIQGEPALLPYLEGFIRSSGDPATQSLAIYYAGSVREKKLLDPLFEVLEDGTNPESRVQSLKALLGYLPNPTVARRIDEVMSVESDKVDESPLWLELTNVLSLEKYHSDEARDMANSAMQLALMSNRPDVFRAAVLFYLLNRELWQDAYADTIKGLGNKRYAKLIKSPGEEYRFLDDEIASAEADSYALEQLQLIKGYVALARLRKGDNAPMLGEYQKPVFPEAVWKDLVREQFPDFTPSVQTVVTERTRLQAHPEEIVRAQDELWSRLKNYSWDESRKLYTYNDPQLVSIARLKQGDVNGLREFVDEEYMSYEPDKWREVLDLFPDYRDKYKDEGVYVEDTWQTILYWELGYYSWDPEQGVYIYEDPQQANIAALLSGDMGPAREYLSTSYYDPEYWLQVLEVFPEFRDRYANEGVFVEGYWQDRLLEVLDEFNWDEARGAFVLEQASAE